jgi:hypothetical protein
MLLWMIPGYGGIYTHPARSTRKCVYTYLAYLCSMQLCIVHCGDRYRGRYNAGTHTSHTIRTQCICISCFVILRTSCCLTRYILSYALKVYVYDVDMIDNRHKHKHISTSPRPPPSHPEHHSSLATAIFKWPPEPMIFCQCDFAGLWVLAAPVRTKNSPIERCNTAAHPENLLWECACYVMPFLRIIRQVEQTSPVSVAHRECCTS